MKRIGKPLELLAVHIRATLPEKGGGNIVVFDSDGVLWLATEAEVVKDETLEVVGTTSTGGRIAALANRLNLTLRRWFGRTPPP